MQFRKMEKRNIIRTAIFCAVCACAVAVMFVTRSVKTNNDALYLPHDNIKLVTRVPIDNTTLLHEEKPNSRVILSWYESTVKLNDKEKKQLNGVMYPVVLKDTSLDFKSSDNTIAEVDNSGNITAKKPGSIEITVKNDYTGISSKAYLQVIQPVTGFWLKKSTINLYTTDMGVRLETEITPIDATNTSVQWYSKDTNIVEVDSNGHLKPINTGMTEIVATTNDGEFSGKCFVNVINEVIKAQTVTIQNKDNITLKVGESWDAIASVLPANAKNKTVEWTSDNESVATVTKNGKVKAEGEGTVKITAKNPDGPSDSVEITVSGSLSNDTANVNTSYASTAQSGVTYVKYDMTLDDMVKAQGSDTASVNRSPASSDKIREYLDPLQFCAGAYRYQFMDLSKYNGISEETLAKFLEGKGTLSGQAKTFIEAAKQYNISELYLVAHACLESGYGTSTLASGVEVNGVKVYNMFGINAYDGSVVSSGSNRAYKEGWTSPALAISGGAKWISEHYINSTEARQNTLYKMRWNPDNPGQHMYAGDVAWATTQAVIMERLFKEFPDAKIYYEIPVYNGSNAAVIDDAEAMSNAEQ